jgi:cysteine desulfurase
MAARVYLDWNATAPPLPAVLDAMREAAREGWGNPSSIHAEGRAARAHVEGARAALAELAGCDVRDVWLTSGGTEANNLAIRSFFADAPGVLLTSRLEHPSVTRVAEVLEQSGRARVSWIAALEDGRIDLDDLGRALDAAGDAPVLLALQAVNHETGVIQPVDEAIALARARTARKAGRVGAGADSRSLAGHKIRGPKGIGALFTREGLTLRPLLVGGAQERGARPGTLDPLAAAGLAVAAKHARSSPARYAELAPLRNQLERSLLAAAPGARVNGSAPRAPHVTNLSFPAWNGAELVAALDLDGLAVSSGSACSAGTIEPSPVIASMLGVSRALTALRVSIGEATSFDEVSRAIDVLTKVIARALPRADA